MGLLNSLFGTKAPRIVQVGPDGPRFEVPPGHTILQAALNAGIAYPHDCTVGTCGTCKSKLMVGRVTALSEFAYTLSREELAANFILPCQSMPKDALTQLDVILDSVQTRSELRRRGTLLRVGRLTHDILHLELEVDLAVEYKAGQYVNLSVPGLERPRSYSLAAAPALGGSNRITLCVRKVPGGAFTEALFKDQYAGATFDIEGPHGGFHLRDGTGPMVCIAGGSGLAPIISILEDALSRRLARPVVLLYGARTRDDLFFIERIEAIAKEWPAPFSFLPVLSHESDASSWAGVRGLVTTFIADRIGVAEKATVQGYLCGPPGMIDAAIARLTNLGVSLDAIFYDKFTDASHAARA